MPNLFSYKSMLHKNLCILALFMLVSCSSGLDLSGNTELECQESVWRVEGRTATTVGRVEGRTATTVDSANYFGEGEGKTVDDALDNAVDAMSQMLKTEANNAGKCSVASNAQRAIMECERELKFSGVVTVVTSSTRETFDSGKDKRCNRHYVELSYDLTPEEFLER